MTSISSTTLDTLAKNSTESAKKAGDTYNQFLVLLTTQLQNQDPLDPMESNEFTNQLVQFSQVEQGILTNSKLDTMLSQSNNNQVGQSLGYIGKDIYFKGDTVYYDGEATATKIGYAIDGASKSSKMRILDKDNQVIRTLDIQPGNTSGSLAWDGKDDQGIKVAAGNYTMKIDALNAEGKQISTYTAAPGHVKGIETVDGILYLALTGDKRVDATNILSISEPDAAAAALPTTPTTPTPTTTA